MIMHEALHKYAFLSELLVAVCLFSGLATVLENFTPSATDEDTTAPPPFAGSVALRCYSVLSYAALRLCSGIAETTAKTFLMVVNRIAKEIS